MPPEKSKPTPAPQRPQFSADELKQLSYILEGKQGAKVVVEGVWIMITANLTFRVIEELQRLGVQAPSAPTEETKPNNGGV